MSKRIVSGLVLTMLLIGILTLAFNIQPVKSEPKTWTVDDDGPADFHTIQEGINHANEGDTIFVRNGTYYEHVVVNKTVSLIGEDMNTTIIDGGETGEVIEVKGSGTMISGFTIRGYLSIICLFGAENTRIYGNIITSNVVPAYGDGIWLWSDSNTVYNNIITNKWAGVYVAGSNNSIIYDNNMFHNEIGILLTHSEHNIIYDNNIIENHKGIRLWLCNSNRINHNNFVKNKQQVYSLNSTDTWDDGYPSGGNYWSDYSGIDADGDGIGDTPYIIDSNNRDRYPLMNPWILDTTPPSITILSPQNTTYTTPSVPLTFTVNESTSWMGYSLDNQANVTISGNTTLTSLSEGSHSIIVYANDTSGNMGASNKVFFTVQIPPPKYTLTIGSMPTGVTFTVDGVSHATPWSGTYDNGILVNLEMPETHSIGEARYYWSQWSDGVTSRTRTVTMNTNVTLTAYYTGLYYELTVTSSPMTEIPFTINGVPKITPYTEWLLETSYTLQMPATYNGYMWSYWLEDGDPNRIKTITLSGTTWTGVFVRVPPAVGGYAYLIEGHTTTQPLTPYLTLIAIITISFTTIRRKTHKKTKQPSLHTI